MIELKNIRQIVLDSRADATDGLFVPIVGERVDGHDYIEMAIAHGAAAVLSQRPVEALAQKYPQVRFYQVADTRLALQELGRQARAAFHGPVVGVTGSVGKTTTREMIACALAAGQGHSETEAGGAFRPARVFETAGNANSQVGVPITMFQLARSGADMAVVELGMSEPGEMTRIAQVACVDLAVITNIGVAHIEQLKTQENILREKLHILDGMRDGGTLYLNGEDPILCEVDLARIRSFGIAVDRDIQVKYYRKGDYQLKLSVPGEHMQMNAMAAMHIAEALGVDRAAAAEALSRFSGLKGRGEIIESGGVTIIDDSYNASPVSMKAGLAVLNSYERSGMEGDTAHSDAGKGADVLSDAAGTTGTAEEKNAGKQSPLASVRTGRRLAVLADMKELGENSKQYHAEIGTYINTLDIDSVYLLGVLAREIGAQVRRAQVRCFDSLETLTEVLLADVRTGDVVLFKGSNSMRLSEAVKALVKAGQTQDAAK